MELSVGRSAFILLVASILCSGCLTTAISPFPVTARPYTSGRILLLPPRDVVQKGVPHPKGVGTGNTFHNYLIEFFSGTAFELVTTDNKKFTNTEIAGQQQSLEEARRLNADYYLQVVFGEFQNTWAIARSNFVSLDRAILYDIRTGKVVWEISKPLRIEKTNWGDLRQILKKYAQLISKSIRENMH